MEWSDSELGADSVYAWAKEQAGEISHEMLDDWMRRNGLSLTTAAQALGMSRRHDQLLPHGGEADPAGRLARLPRLGSVTRGERKMAERTGLEPATPGVTGRYSNQLNYRSNRGGC